MVTRKIYTKARAQKVEDSDTQVRVHFQSGLFKPNPIKSKPDVGRPEPAKNPILPALNNIIPPLES